MKKMFDTQRTIVALSTPIGNGGISIVRLSGENAVAIADKMFFSKSRQSPSSFESRRMVFGNIVSDVINENCLCVVFRSPDSFTGDDVVEFQCHGGVRIAENVVKKAIENGAQLARCGEFSMRAFANGKMTLAEAEGMMDIINAESESELRAGYSLAGGDLSREAERMQREIIEIMSDVEVSFDYPEHDIEYKTKEDITQRLVSIERDIKTLLSTTKMGAIIKSGINVVIVGKPNVGKSSILNKLVGRERAIVTNIPGTTRDVIEDSFEIKGVKVNIIDTAGIRDSKDIIENIGVEKSKELIKQADVILLIIDNNEGVLEDDLEILKLAESPKLIVVANKSDLKTHSSFKNSILISAKTGKGIEELKNAIYDKVIDSNVISSAILITNERHVEALKSAIQSIESALKGIKNLPLDVISVDIMDAYSELGEITGTTSSEEIIDSIFKKFCLGK